jgi:Tfp pilus assembly protein PilX
MKLQCQTTCLRRERGVALIFVLVVLLITTIIGTSAMRSTMLDTQVAGNASETRTVFQATETLLAAARNSDITVFSAAIAGNPGNVTTLSIDPVIASSYSNTNLEAKLTYVGEGTVAFGSSIGKFKPQRFEVSANVERLGSGATANHEQGVSVLSPGT